MSACERCGYVRPSFWNRPVPGFAFSLAAVFATVAAAAAVMGWWVLVGSAVGEVAIAMFCGFCALSAKARYRIDLREGKE